MKPDERNILDPHVVYSISQYITKGADSDLGNVSYTHTHFSVVGIQTYLMQAHNTLCRWCSLAHNEYISFNF